MATRRALALWILAGIVVAAPPDAAAEAPAGSASGPAETPVAPAELPPWMSADVVKAAVAIGLNDAQLHQFNEFVGGYVTDHFAMVEEAKREAPDLDRRVKSRDTALVHRLDECVRPLLTTEQWRAYETYKRRCARNWRRGRCRRPRTGRGRRRESVAGKAERQARGASFRQ